MRTLDLFLISFEESTLRSFITSINYTIGSKLHATNIRSATLHSIMATDTDQQDLEWEEWDGNGTLWSLHSHNV